MPDRTHNEYTASKQTLTSADGSAELTFISELPDLGDSELERFYKALCCNCLAFCKRSILPKCIPSHTYVYKLRVRPLTEGDMLTITLAATLSDKTERRTLRSAKHTHVWKLVGSKPHYILCRGARKSE